MDHIYEIRESTIAGPSTNQFGNGRMVAFIGTASENYPAMEKTESLNEIKFRVGNGRFRLLIADVPAPVEFTAECIEEIVIAKFYQPCFERFFLNTDANGSLYCE